MSATRSGWRGWDTSVRATVLGTVAGVLSLLVAVAAWQWPRPPDDPAAAAAAPAGTSAAVAPAGTAAAAAPEGTEPAGADLLDGITAESGGSHLVEVPRPIRAGALDHPVAITCPSNETGDQEHSVTYAVKGRYVTFEAGVLPYYPPGADARSATYVTVLAGTRERDGALTTAQAGAQQRATPAAPQRLTATIDGAEKLTVRVQCADPNGVVVLTGARLLPAA